MFLLRGAERCVDPSMAHNAGISSRNPAVVKRTPVKHQNWNPVKHLAVSTSPKSTVMILCTKLKIRILNSALLIHHAMLGWPAAAELTSASGNSSFATR